MLYVPVGFAHGFCVLSEVADVLYKQTAYYDPSIERGIAWNDPDVGIEWPRRGRADSSPRATPPLPCCARSRRSCRSCIPELANSRP